MNCKPTFINECLKENVIIMMMMMIMVIEKHAKSVSATSSSGVT